MGPDLEDRRVLDSDSADMSMFSIKADVTRGAPFTGAHSTRAYQMLMSKQRHSFISVKLGFPTYSFLFTSITLLLLLLFYYGPPKLHLL